MLAYFTLTGQTRKFVNKVSGVESVEIKPDNPFIEMEEPYILVVPTYDAEITEPVNDFLETGQNIELCKGIFAGGNRNFAQLFCFTADDLSEEYGIPVLHRFEFQGGPSDVAKLEEELGIYAK